MAEPEGCEQRRGDDGGEHPEFECALQLALTHEGQLVIEGFGPLTLAVGMLERAIHRLIAEHTAPIEEGKGRVIVPRIGLGPGARM